jgi:MFS family permease
MDNYPLDGLEPQVRRPFGLPLAWWIAVGTTLGMCLSYSSFATIVFGQFVRPISEAYGWTRAQTTGGMAIVFFLMIPLAPAAGYFLDHFGSRRVLLIASVLLPLVIASVPLVHGSLMRFYLLMVLFAIISAGTLPGTYTSIILGWFDRRRGFGFGFPVAGIGMAGIVLPPVLRLMITKFGWEVAIVAVGIAMFLVVVPLAAFLLRLTPNSEREVDGGMPAATPSQKVRAFINIEIDWKVAIRTRKFIQLAIAFILVGVVTMGVLVNLQAMLQDNGVAAFTVAKLLSLQGAFMLFFRLFSGWLMDRFPPRVVAGAIVLAPAFGIGLIALNPTVPALVIAVPLLAAGFGGEFTVMSFFTSRYFGRGCFGKLYGLTYAAFNIGGCIGPPLLAGIYDRTHAYTSGLVLFALLVVAAALMIFSLPSLVSDTSSHAAAVPVGSTAVDPSGAGTENLRAMNHG